MPTDTRQVFLDTETTGLYADHGDRVVEIGCIELINRRPTGRVLHHYLNPERPSDAEALEVHGLSQSFLADKPCFGDVANELMAFVAGAEVVIHNASFDIGFLDAELVRLGLPGFGSGVHGTVDTLRLARDMFPGKANSLDSLCKRLQIDNSARTLHGALLDAQLLSQVYVAMTRQQSALALGGERRPVAAMDTVDDLSRYHLQVLEPTNEELAVHQAMLEEMAAQIKMRPAWLTMALSATETGAGTAAVPHRKVRP